ncbi:Zinc/iron permease [Mycena sp. CBHHK59/15]|nr:Zinc/iron permease [Mycena sp. CBHHK59/15]
MSSDSGSECGNLNNADTYLGLRVSSVFIILFCATGGALFPVLAKRSAWLQVPKFIFEFAKYFGSGVIIATAFIHLLSPGLDDLSSDCLSPAWLEYVPIRSRLGLLSIFSIFVLELVAFRWGTTRLQTGVHHDTHGHNAGSHAAHGPEGADSPPTKYVDDAEEQSTHKLTHLDDSASAQIIGIAILEFGLTHVVDQGFKVLFKVLFVVIIFHQTFEGLGLGSWLAFIRLPLRYNYVPIAAAIVYGLSTPIY